MHGSGISPLIHMSIEAMLEPAEATYLKKPSGLSTKVQSSKQ